MSNGVDFRKLALDLRGELTAAQSELAELQATIARLTAEIEDWKQGSQAEASAGDEARAAVATLKAEIDRLKGGQGEPFEGWAERELGLPKHRIASGDYQSFGMSCAEKAWNASQPAPVSVDERAEFESWVTHEWVAAPTGYSDRCSRYIDDSVQRAWVGWQARACLDKLKELNQ